MSWNDHLPHPPESQLPPWALTWLSLFECVRSTISVMVPLACVIKAPSLPIGFQLHSCYFAPILYGVRWGSFEVHYLWDQTSPRHIIIIGNRCNAQKYTEKVCIPHSQQAKANGFLLTKDLSKKVGTYCAIHIALRVSGKSDFSAPF